MLHILLIMLDLTLTVKLLMIFFEFYREVMESVSVIL